MEEKDTKILKEGILYLVELCLNRNKNNFQTNRLATYVHKAKNAYANYDQFIEESMRKGDISSDEYIIKTEDLFHKFNETIANIVKFSQEEKINIKYKGKIKKISQVYNQWHTYYECNWKRNIYPSEEDTENYKIVVDTYLPQVISLLHKIDLY